jgi:hypothetical protein
MFENCFGKCTRRLLFWEILQTLQKKMHFKNWILCPQIAGIKKTLFFLKYFSNLKVQNVKLISTHIRICILKPTLQG